MKNKKKKIIFILAIIVASFCSGSTVFAAEDDSFSGLQIMPKAIPCSACGCDCDGADRPDDCLRKCILACKSRDAQCYNNLCYSPDVEPKDAGVEPKTPGLYQCSSCIIDGDCFLNDFLQIGVNIANIVLILSGAFALLAFMFSAFKFLTSMGDSAKIKSGIDGMKNVVIGLACVLLAWMMVGKVQDLLGFKDAFKLEAIDITQGDSDDDSSDSDDPEDTEDPRVAVGCCVPRLDRSSPPLSCVAANMGETTCGTGYEYEEEKCEDMLDKCMPKMCKFKEACGVGCSSSCEEREACVDVDIVGCMDSSLPCYFCESDSPDWPALYDDSCTSPDQWRPAGTY